MKRNQAKLRCYKPSSSFMMFRSDLLTRIRHDEKLKMLAEMAWMMPESEKDCDEFEEDEVYICIDNPDAEDEED